MKHGGWWLGLLGVLAGCLAESSGPFDWSLFDASASLPEPSEDAAGLDSPDAAVHMEDDARDAELPEAHAFTDAPAFVRMGTPVSARTQMAESGVNPTKTACLSCHDGEHASAFLAGGTLFEDVTRGAPAEGSEVRVVDSDSGEVYAARSDADGNFWIPRPNPAPRGPFLIGVRNESALRLMPLLQRGLDCNGSACHGGAQGPIHLP